MSFFPLKQSIAINGTDIGCVSFGSGSQPLVILPGLSVRDASDAALPLALMYRSFARHFRVYVLDKPRHIPEGCTIEELARDTGEAMEKLGISRAHVLAVSMGGMIAQVLACERPQLLRSLVLAVSTDRADRPVRSAISLWTELVREGDYAAFGRNMFEMMYTPAYLRRYSLFMPLLARLSAPKEPGRFLNLAQAILSFNPQGKCPSVSCPAYVIGGGQDRILGSEAALRLSQSLGCPVHVYEKLGHAAYEEAPDFNTRVLEFFLSH